MQQNRHYVMFVEEKLAELEAINPQGLDPKQLKAHNARLRSARLKVARTKGRHTTEQWQALVAETGGICVRCGYQHDAKFEKPAKGLITPLACGGSLDISNLMPLCMSCVSSKREEQIDWLADWRNQKADAGIPEGA